MSRRQVLEIARWEFLRYFKLRDAIITALLVAGISGASAAFSWWQARSRDTARVAVISPVPLVSSSERLVFEPRRSDELPALRAQVEAETLDGVVIVEPPAVRVIAAKEPPWLGEVGAAASAALQQRRLEALGVTPAQLAEALAPAEVELELLVGERRDGAALVPAAVVIGMMLLALFTGLAYLFMGITGEKQQRVTEQVFVMTSAQALIDGKLLGLGALTLVVTAQTVVVGAVAFEVFAGGLWDAVVAPLARVGAFDLATVCAFGAAGFAFWFALSAAWFATISDPNSSARSNALLLPFLPLSAVFVGLSDPGSSMMQALGYVPLTSMTVMPARVVLADVSPVEVAVSLALLVAATAWLRRAAARIFEAAMLMYGKEPGLREMARWLRASRRRAGQGP